MQKNKSEFEIMNLSKWHNAGYTGKNVTVCVLDTVLGTEKMEHADMVIKTIQTEIAPDVNIKHLEFINAGWDKKKAAIEWIKENKPDIINCSFVSKSGYMPFFPELKDLDIPIVCATGNDGYEDKILYPARFDYTIAIGAYEEIDREVEKYSNKGLEIDAVAFTDIAIRDFNGVIKTKGGTSIAIPVAVGMLALYTQLLKEYGLQLTRKMAREFVHNNCYDIGVKGRDNESGFGLFILPIEIPDVSHLKQLVIKLKLGSNKMMINNEEKKLRVAPFYKQYTDKYSALCTELRPIFEEIGFDVDWNSETGEVIIRK